MEKGIIPASSQTFPTSSILETTLSTMKKSEIFLAAAASLGIDQNNDVGENRAEEEYFREI